MALNLHKKKVTGSSKFNVKINDTEVSLISVIFQYDKQAAHFIFSYYGFFTFEKLMVKLSRIRVRNEYIACGSFLHS